MNTPSDGPVPGTTLEALRGFDTPTVCNALELVAPARRAVGFTVEPLVCARPLLPPIVGYARTAAIRAKEPNRADAQAARAERLAYYEYVAAGPGPTVVVIQDLDGAKAGYGAYWGEVQSNIHKGLGCLGGVTDGAIRDLDVLAEGFQLLAGRIGPSHAHVHLEGHGGTVDVAGMLVASGDLIHADRHGAVVVPHDVAADIPAAVDLLVRKEAVILGAARGEGFGINVLRKALADAEEIH